MKYLFVFLLASMPLLAVRADDATATTDRADKSNKNAVAFTHDGIWKPKGAILDGVFLPPPVLAAITLTIAKDTYHVKVEGEDHSDKGTFTIDTSVTPKRMTIKSHAGPNKGKTFLAIYESKNEQSMRVCYDLTGKAFPKEFKAPKGSKLYVVGYRRHVAEPDNGKTPSQESKPE